MAGTGHPYEIANPSAVDAALAGYGGRSATSARWLATRHVRRFVTGPAFTVRLEPGPEGRQLVEAGAPEGPGREATLAKLARGGDVRVFVAAYLRAAGPDIGHVLDWMDSLDRSGDRMAARIERVGVADAVAAAGRWSAALARRAALAGGIGRVEPFVAGRGARWWVELLDREALAYESGRMDHCVADYHETLGRGRRIFSLRSGDAPLVTVEVFEIHSALRHVGQVRAHGNRVPDNALRLDVAALANELACSRDLYGEAAALGLELAADGVWRTFDEVGTRARVAGMEGIGFGDRFYVSSRVDPEIFVATATGEPGWWEREDGRFRILTPNGDRAVRIADLRLLADLANARADPDAVVGGGLVRGGNAGPWTAWPDTMERRDHGTAACLSKGSGPLLVARASEVTDVLLMLERKREGGLLEPKDLAERQWSASDVRLVAAALNGIGGAAVHDRNLRAAGLRQDPAGRWLLWADECERRPYPGETPDGRPLVWEVTPWCLELVGPSRSPLVTVRTDREGRVSSVTAPFASPQHYADAARLMNEMDLPMAPSLHDDARYFRNLSAAGGSERGILVRADGRWRMVAGDGVAAFLATLGRRQFADPALNELAVSLLPAHGADPAADALLARHLANLIAAADRKDLLARIGIEGAWRDRSVRRSTDERLAAAAALMPLMAARERKAVVTAATRLLRDLVGRRRKPPSLAHWSVGPVRTLVRAYWAHLPQALLERAVPYVLYIGSLDRRTSEGERLVEVEWADMIGAVGPHARYAIQESAGMSAYSIVGDDARLPRTIDAWSDWVAMCRACASDRWRGERVREALARLEEHGRTMGWSDSAGPALPLAA